MIKENKDSNYYNFGLFLNPFFYSPVIKTGLVKYQGRQTIGEWYFKVKLHNNSEMYIPKESFLKSGRIFLNKILNKEKKFTNYLLKICFQVIELDHFLSVYSYKIFKNKKAVNLQDFYNKYEDVFSKAGAFAYPLDFAIEEELKKKALTIPKLNFVSFEKQENIDLYKISIIDSKEQKEALLKEHIAKYFWIKADYTGGHEPSLEYFKKRLRSVKKPQITTEKNFKNFNSSKSIDEWINFLAYIRDVRKKCNLIANTLLDRYLKMECKRRNISYNKASMLFIDEFKKQVNYNISDYKQVRYILAKDGKVKDLKLEDWNKLFLKRLNSKHQKIITGFPVCKGLIKGRVRIIIEKKDFKKFNKQEVLVTHMTRPNFFPLMKMASAIVTDEGGITCHASVVSREIGVPCIVSTNIATKILKDGDLVEVDANQGKVRIIK